MPEAAGTERPADYQWFRDLDDDVEGSCAARADSLYPEPSARPA